MTLQKASKAYIAIGIDLPVVVSAYSGFCIVLDDTTHSWGRMLLS